MRCVVQKYGGSSVADLDKIRRVALRICETVERGVGVVAVVSAMGNTTNELIALARELTDAPDPRELDMLISVGERITMALLAMALRERGVAARSLTGSQSGIITDEAHAGARVVEVRPSRVRQCLEAGEVVIVAGFQGVSREREVTTLGRGGSDTTAVVLAAALGAEHCEICSDVDGVWSADPRVVPEARKLAELGLDVGLALARGGAKVLFEDAVRYARDHGVAIVATTTFGPGSGSRLSARGVVEDGVVAVTADRLVAVAPLEDVVDAVTASGGRVRRVVGTTLHVDVRNAHGGLDLPVGATQEPCAVVTAVGSGVGERPTHLVEGRARLSAAGIAVAEVGGQGDQVWFRVPVGREDDAVRLLHDVWVATV
jgi:aspartate kinase